MKKVVKTAVVVFVVGLSLTSCSKNSTSEDDAFFEVQATVGDNGSDEEQRGGGN